MLLRRTTSSALFTACPSRSVRRICVIPVAANVTPRPHAKMRAQSSSRCAALAGKGKLPTIGVKPRRLGRGYKPLADAALGSKDLACLAYKPRYVPAGTYGGIHRKSRLSGMSCETCESSPRSDTTQIKLSSNPDDAKTKQRRGHGQIQGRKRFSIGNNRVCRITVLQGGEHVKASRRGWSGLRTRPRLRQSGGPPRTSRADR